MLCYYGANDIFIDVTEIVLHYFKIDSFIKFPEGSKNFNSYFNDPICGVVKNLIIHFEDQIININENDTNEYCIDLNTLKYPTDIKILELMNEHNYNK